MSASSEDFTAAKGVTYEDIEEKNVQGRHLDYLLDQRFVPTGGVLMYGGDKDPSGFYICDGREVSRAKDRALFGIIGTRFGAGDGKTTFNIPLQDGYVPRGAPTKSTNVLRDPDADSRTAMAPGGAKGRLVGSVQEGSIIEHQHSATTTGISVTLPGSGGAANPGGPVLPQVASLSNNLPYPATVSGGISSVGNVSGVTASTENRMVNSYYNFIIKR